MFRDYNKLPDKELIEMSQESNPKQREINEIKRLALKIEYNSFYYPSANLSNIFYCDVSELLTDATAYENITHVGQIITETLIKYLNNEKTV